MPPVLVPIIAAIGVELGSAFLIMYAVQISTAILLIGGLAMSAVKARQAREDARNAYNARQVDRLRAVASPVAPREMVLGRVRKSGSVFYRGSNGQHSENYYMAIALAAHEIDAIEAYYLNDVQVTLDAGGFVEQAPYLYTNTYSAQAPRGGPYLGAVVPGSQLPIFTGGTDQIDTGNVNYQYQITSSSVRIVLHNGAAGQGADPTLLAAFHGEWLATNVVQGVAYLLIVATYSETAFPSGLPTLSAIVRGAKLYDPRNGLTVWSQNPALMMRHLYQHANFGKAQVSAEEDTRFIATANACDTSTNYVVNGVTEVNPLYRAAIVLPFGTPAKSAFDDLAQAMAGSWCFAGGSLFIKAGQYTAPVLTLTDADLAVVQTANGGSQGQQPIGISVHKERAQKFNTVKVKIWDQAQDYKMAALPPLVGTVLLARDGVELAQEITLPAVGYAPQALHCAGVAMRDARDALVVVLPFKLSAYALEPFDNVYLTLARYGWSGKAFQVLARQWSANGNLQLTLKETNASITQVDAGFLAAGFAANTNLPKPWEVASVGTLTCTTGTAELQRQSDGTITSRLRVSWAQIADAAVRDAGQIEVQYRLASATTDWQSLVVAGDETQAVTANVQDEQWYLVRARARTSLAVGDWGLQTQVLVLGKTEPPAAPATLSLTDDRAFWPGVADLDLAGYRLRNQPGATLVWPRATALHDGLVTNSPWAFSTALYGLQTVGVVAVDTTGNESAATTATFDFGQPDSSSVVQSTDLRAAGWPAGTLTLCSVSAGDLVANVATSLDLYAIPDWYTEPDLYATAYEAMVYTTPPFAASWGGGTLTLVYTAVGADVTIEYMTEGSALFDLYASADLYAEPDLYGAGSAWLPWPGALEAPRMVGIVFRVSIAGGTQQGVLSQFVLSLSAVEVDQTYTTSISSAGTRLNPASGTPPRQWISLRSVQVTPVVDSAAAIAGRVLDFSAADGPLVQLLDASFAPVTAPATVHIKGLADL